MTSEVTPDAIRRAEFRTTLRGLDRAEVESMLDAVATRLEELEAERRKLKAQIADMPATDMASEFETVGREVAAILQSAREAAESMRERASLDASRWRSEAIEEADTARKEAAADAEALRRDAWVTGSQLLEQSDGAAEAMRAAAERDVLTVMGEAEREAHRLTSGARREAEDLVRGASMDAEKMTADATKRRDEIIDGANRQAATAQERARALESRRDELLEELENVRSTLTKLEGSLEERREALDLTASQPSNVKVVHPPADAKKQWELGETVRVLPPESRDTPDPDAGIAEEMREQVARIQQPEPDPRVPPEPKPDAVAEPEPEPDHEPESTPLSEAPDDSQSRSDDLATLFAALRGGGDTQPSPTDEAEEPSATADDEEGDGTDWISVRESRLLPITNRALRGVKKAMTEVQNVALDSLRTDEGWQPEKVSISDAVHAELVAVWSESFSAGHAVAELMAGDKLRRPITPSSKADEEFASDLASAVSSALDQAGDGSRERQSAASRVFRVWRSDEAERRIRDIALLGYETGIEKSRSVTTG